MKFHFNFVQMHFRMFKKSNLLLLEMQFFFLKKRLKKQNSIRYLHLLIQLEKTTLYKF